mmetsp:Transcript_27702/g.52723  ORF Transcript_27702/g.52723 Transcript_27702/m.52723 type:complete len:278 (-) Transcript_27702:3140-3973(-)
MSCSSLLEMSLRANPFSALHSGTSAPVPSPWSEPAIEDAADDSFERTLWAVALAAPRRAATLVWVELTRKCMMSSPYMFCSVAVSSCGSLGLSTSFSRRLMVAASSMMACRRHTHSRSVVRVASRFRNVVAFIIGLSRSTRLYGFTSFILPSLMLRWRFVCHSQAPAAQRITTSTTPPIVKPRFHHVASLLFFVVVTSGGAEGGWMATHSSSAGSKLLASSKCAVSLVETLHSHARGNSTLSTSRSTTHCSPILYTTCTWTSESVAIGLCPVTTRRV